MVDAHTHVFFRNDELDAVFEHWNLRVVVINITGKGIFSTSMDKRWQAMRELKSALPDRVTLCTSFDANGVASEGFADRVITNLNKQIREGAQLVKVWKDVGLDVRDRNGALVQVDDARFRPIWEFLASEGIPVIAHVGDPRAAWQVLDPSSPHYQFYSTHPDQHLLGRTDLPSWETLMEARDRWIENHPDLIVIGAHFGSMAHDVEQVAKRLDAYPNFFVDTAERFGDLTCQDPEVVSSFFSKYHTRILYGSDIIIDDPRRIDARSYDRMLQRQISFLSEEGPVAMPGKLDPGLNVRGLGLSEEVLEDICKTNARRLLGAG